jgi:REP element-mobilizing transposase RayT
MRARKAGTMSDPLAYFISWTCYGTWLPGDQRGWVDKHEANSQVPYKAPDPKHQAWAMERMAEPPVTLTTDQRGLAERAIRETCRHRTWVAHEVNVRSNHAHIVVTAPNTTPERVLQSLKANATRLLKTTAPRKHWWTEGGSTRYLNNEQSVAAAIQYVRDQ